MYKQEGRNSPVFFHWLLNKDTMHFKIFDTFVQHFELKAYLKLDQN